MPTLFHSRGRNRDSPQRPQHTGDQAEVMKSFSQGESVPKKINVGLSVNKFMALVFLDIHGIIIEPVQRLFEEPMTPFVQEEGVPPPTQCECAHVLNRYDEI